MAVLSAIAEDPRRIQDRIKITEINEAGIYCVTFYINGEETPVIIDDYFPYYQFKPAFCRTKDNEIWGMLLEKAWAKVHGSYERTNGGLVSHAVKHMIGLPAWNITHKTKKFSDDEMWEKLKRFDTDGFVMIA